jgi:hypothetical protein
MRDHDQGARDAAWREHALSQLRYFRSLSLRAKLEAIQQLADTARLFERMRAEARFRTAGDPDAGLPPVQR